LEIPLFGATGKGGRGGYDVEGEVVDVPLQEIDRVFRGMEFFCPGRPIRGAPLACDD